MSNKKRYFIYALSLSLVLGGINISNASSLKDELDSKKDSLESSLQDVNNKIDEEKNYIDSVKNQLEDSTNIKNQLDKEISDIVNNKNSTVEKINEINKLIQDTLNKIHSIKNDIFKLESEIEQKNIDINKVSSSIDYNNQLLRKRIKAMYKLGEASKIQILLNASNINDFLSRTTMMTTITDSDKRLIENLRNYKDQLSELKNELNVRNEKLIESKNQLEETQKSLDEQKKYNDELYKKLTEQEKEKSGILSELNRSIVEYEKYLEEKQSQEYSLIEQQNKLKSEIANIEAEILEEERRIELAEQEEEDKALKAKKEAELQAKNDELSNISNQQSDSNTKLLWPTSATYISSPYGWRERPIYGGYSFHYGLDIAGPYDTPIYAAEDGVVEAVYYNYGDYGNFLIINHGNGLKTAYAHLNSFLVSEGQRVSRGQHVARMGSTGYSTGPHVHFEVRVNGERLNPINYIR